MTLKEIQAGAAQAARDEGLNPHTKRFDIYVSGYNQAVERFRALRKSYRRKCYLRHCDREQRYARDHYHELHPESRRRVKDE